MILGYVISNIKEWASIRTISKTFHSCSLHRLSYAGIVLKQNYFRRKETRNYIDKYHLHFPHLQSYKGHDLMGNDIEQLSLFHNLIHLNLYVCNNLQSSSYILLNKLIKLVCLEIHECNISTAHFQYILSDMKHLTHLSISECTNIYEINNLHELPSLI